MASHRQRCRIKIIVNPDLECGFAMYSSPNKPIAIKIFLTKCDDIHAVIDNMNGVFPTSFCWDIEWNWTNVPRAIKENLNIRKKILEIFSARPPNLTDKYYYRENTDYTHPLEHAADFDDSIDERVKKVLDYIYTYRIIPNMRTAGTHNFICFILNDTTLSKNESSVIAKRVSEEFVPNEDFRGQEDDWGK